MHGVYFNEFDKYPANWLRNLFPDAHVDDRSIKDVGAADTTEYLRCHFFAGIGGWEYALQLAGWPADREVWTGSCPCQPFSQAGKRKGEEDERHLWPDFLRLIAERRPSTIFGEQVASPDGRRWLAGVRSDVEALGYRFGAADLCAAGVGAPHNRPRLYWVAHCGGERRQQIAGSASGNETKNGRESDSDHVPECSNESSRAISNLERDGRGAGRGAERNETKEGIRRGESAASREILAVSPLPDSNITESSDGRIQRSWSIMQPGENQAHLQWGDTAIICGDGKARRIEPSILPLAHGIPNRVGRIRAYGNAIVPQVAARFITAFLMAEQDLLIGNET